MDKFVIGGGNRLDGEVKISGAKNAALPLIAAAILAPGVYHIDNVPPLTDIKTMCKLLGMLGGNCALGQNCLDIDTINLYKFEAPYELVKTMRASIYVLGPLLARFGRAKVSLPGGCAWGPRPVNLHIEGMKQLGAEIDLLGGYIVAKARKLHNAIIDLDFPSVGATGNIMMAAALIEGETVINNAACEPDIAALAQFLTKMGVEIEGVGTPSLKIFGSKDLKSCDFINIPDRIEAGTFLIAAAITGGKVKLTGCEPQHCLAVIQKLRQTGCKIETGQDWMEIERAGKILPVDVVTEVYPGYPTDLQAQWIALMALADGKSQIEETVYGDRFTHVPELMRLGADVVMNKSTAVVMGKSKLFGAQVMSTDIRASASLILAALAAEGITEVSRIYHIDRGYYRIEEKLAALGAKISRQPGTF